ncbi:hypothetical protein [uncultured Stenotrophomonas sp.]|uniref:hypothetical protein n=1 Tax=uncultured Stenotrophomonas sp. TaxID=165438 RepID=UPI0025D823B6|nr:hypothetical protein [uncultured Stenotrophomonas sp.]
MKALWITTLLLACLLPNAARAEQTPEDVGRAYKEAINARGMAAMTDFIHPEELQRFKSMFAPLLTEEQTESSAALLHIYFGEDASVESVREMPAGTFMARIMKFAESQMGGAAVRIEDQQFLGSVNEGALVHMVTRNTVSIGAIRLTKMEVVSMRPYGDSWRMLLSGDVEGMAKAIRARFEKGTAEKLK